MVVGGRKIERTFSKILKIKIAPLRGPWTPQPPVGRRCAGGRCRFGENGTIMGSEIFRFERKSPIPLAVWDKKYCRRVLSLWLAGWLVVSHVCLLSRVSLSAYARGPADPRVRAHQFSYFSFYQRDAMLARSLRQRRVRLSVRTSVHHTPVLCLAERKQDREMHTF